MIIASTIVLDVLHNSQYVDLCSWKSLLIRRPNSASKLSGHPVLFHMMKPLKLATLWKSTRHYKAKMKNYVRSPFRVTVEGTLQTIIEVVIREKSSRSWTSLKQSSCRRWNHNKLPRGKGRHIVTLLCNLKKKLKQDERAVGWYVRKDTGPPQVLLRVQICISPMLVGSSSNSFWTAI